jgi:hypothetical protein
VAANERKFLRCAGDSLAVPWSGRPCRPCLPTSAPVRSMSWWSTRSTGAPKKKPWTVADRGSRSEKLRLGEKTRSVENEGIIREVLGRRLLCARHHCEWINLNRYGHGNTGLRV